MQVFRLEFLKFRILEILNFHPCNYYFIFSSQVLFSISQKLIQHQIINYTEILKWLQEILVCRNSFLQKHSSNANIGSNIPVCKQAHIKLEVCIHNTIINQLQVNPVLSGHSKRIPKLMVFKTDYHLMQVKSIAECSKRAFCNTSTFI